MLLLGRLGPPPLLFLCGVVPTSVPFAHPSSPTLLDSLSAPAAVVPIPFGSRLPLGLQVAPLLACGPSLVSLYAPLLGRLLRPVAAL